MICLTLLRKIAIEQYGRTEVSLPISASERDYGLRDFRIRRDKAQCTADRKRYRTIQGPMGVSRWFLEDGRDGIDGCQT